MQIAVCDDEKIYIDLLSGFIKNCMALHEDDYCNVSIDAFTSGEELMKSYDAGKNYDLIFLDIRMGKFNGFDTARHIRQIDDKVMIIFVTSLKDYIFNSFEYKPFWFLIKPVAEDKFRHVFNKAIMEIRDIKTRKYSFYSREYGLLSIDINTIMYLESMLRKIIIHTTAQQHIYYASLKEEEEKLKKYNFVRIHKAYLVNMAYIQRINKKNVVLKNSAVLPLSEHRFKEVFDCFTTYLARCAI